MSSQRVLLFCSLLSLCVLVPPSAADSPVITSVEPAFGFNDEETLITVRGEGFQPGDRVALLDGTGYEFVTLVPTDGESRDILAQDGWLYVADGPAGVRVFDLGDPRQPALVRTVDTPGFATDLAFEGGTLVVADGAGGIQIIDVTDPPRAERSGGLAGLGDATIVAMASGFAYVAAGDRLSVIDARAPEAPEVVASYPFEGAIGALAANADVVFVAHQIPSDSPYRSRWKLDLLSASDPQALHSIGSMNYWHGKPTDLRVEGGVVYVSGVIEDHEADHFIVAADVSMPGPPWLIGLWSNYTDERPLSPAQRQGMRLAVDGESGLLTTCSSIGEEKPGLYVVDLPAISTFSLGHFVSMVMRPNSCPHSVSSTRGYAYISDTQGGVHVIDMRDRPSMHDGARVVQQRASDAIFLLIDGEILYFGIEFRGSTLDQREDSLAAPDERRSYDSRTRVSAYDLANSANPRFIESMLRDGFMTVVAARDGCFYYQTAYAGYDIYMRSFGEENCSGWLWDSHYHEIAHLDGYLYGANFRNLHSIDAIDVRDSAHVTVRGVVDLPGYPRKLAASARTLLVVETPQPPRADDVLRVLDVSTPESPRIASALTTIGEIRDLDVVGTTAALSTGEHVLLVDFSDPDRPSVLSAFATPGRTGEIAIGDGFVAVVVSTSALSTYADEVLLLDVSDPTAPFVAGSFIYDSEAVGMEIAKGRVFVAGTAYHRRPDPRWNIGVASLISVELRTLVERTNAASDTTMEALVSEASPVGSYDVCITGPNGRFARREKGFRVCEERMLSLSLEPIAEASPGGAPLDQGRWTTRLAGDAVLFENDDSPPRALYDLPPLPPELDVTFVSAPGQLVDVVEIHMFADAPRGAVRLIGADEPALRALWSRIAATGGIELTAVAENTYGNVSLRAVRGPVPAEVLRSGPYGVRASTVFRFEFKNGDLDAAKAWGPHVDHLFRAEATYEWSCVVEDTKSYDQTRREWCEQWASEDPHRALRCERF